MKNGVYEVVVIGAGSAGYAAASKLGDYGIRTALVERDKELGGLCILRGCMPSKIFIESANLFRRMKTSAEFGIHADGLQVSMEEVQERKQRLVKNFQSYRENELRDGNFDLVRGSGTFISDCKIKVEDTHGDRILRFSHAVIATGSTSVLPKIDGLKDGNYWLSRDSLETREIPEHLVIIGGGAIGCEMAHCFEGLGSNVTIINRSESVLKDFDEDISKLITSVSRKRGITVHCNTHVTNVRYLDGDGVVVSIESDGNTAEINGTHLLVATGRKPAIDALDLDAVGVKTEKNRISTNGYFQTNAEHIFAIGDASAQLPVVHEAVIQGENVAKHIAIRMGILHEVIPFTEPLQMELFGVFTHPECARVGMNAERIQKLGYKTATATYPFSDHGKAEILDETDGFVKIVCEEVTGKILSASAVGPQVIDLIHEMQIAIHAGLTVSEFLAIPHYHPTLAEIWTYPAEKLAEEIS